MRAFTIAFASMLLACGGAPAHEETMTRATPPPETTVPSPFAGHGPFVLRSQSPSTQPPFYAELAADGEVTGTRCAATRFTDEGVLEREGVVIARVIGSDDGFVVETPSALPLGWRIERGALETSGSRFDTSDGTITPSDAELPTITFDPSTTPPALVLALFATLLVCDDVGP